MTDEPIEQGELLELTSDIVSAYASKNPISSTELPELIRSVYAALSDLRGDGAPEAEAPEPAVPVKRSVTPDYIVCLEDGKKLKMLRRHLKTAYDMTPEEYRAKWSLPANYPMVAPNYTKKRQMLAKKIGLGRMRRKDEEAA